jgi:hypothetical protein
MDMPSSPRRVLGDDEFVGIFQPHVNGLLELALYAAERPDEPVNRPFLNSVYARTNRAIEVLDSCGARGNQRWFPFCVRLAALRNLAMAAHELRHVHHSAPDYNALQIEGDFLGDTSRAVGYFDRVIHCVLDRVLVDAKATGLRLPTSSGIAPERFAENLPPGRLVRDREVSHAESTADHIVSLATQYLEVDASIRFLDPVLEKPEDWEAFIPEPVSEESLRQIMSSFHNLQSAYDTFVRENDTERADGDLLILRGHASLALHLFRVGSILTHLYERHMVGNGQFLLCCGACPLSEKTFRWLLFEYCIGYGWRFSQEGLPVAHRIVRRYAEVGEIEVPVPGYHGFHVRPSTYISQIIKHYGSKATMVLGDTEYDAGSIFELFRANQEIQMRKREQICRLVATKNTDRPLSPEDDVRTEVRRVLLDLAAERMIMIHEELDLEKLEFATDRPLFELIADAVFHLLRTGQIDVRTDLTATIRGDKRVLHDIKLLAEAGYGEDIRGNNVPLPPELDYLKHTT